MPPLRELALLFLRLGATSFGGPAVHIAMMEEEVVRRRGWLTPEEFLTLVAATNFIPGPNSTELAIHIGHQRAGIKGLIVAGGCFIAPAAIIVLAIAWCYERFGTLPAMEAVLYGIKPVVIAIVLQAVWSLGKTAIRGPFLLALSILAAGASVLGVGEITILVVAAAIAGTVERLSRRNDTHDVSALLPPMALPLSFAGTGAVAAAAVTSVSAPKIFLLFLKIGSVLFGSGYVLLAFLRADLVDRLHWLTSAQLLDAVAVGQVTPGPVFTTATFIGYLLAGFPGAAAATAGIFLPAFLFVAITAPFIARLRSSQLMAGVLNGLNVASLALMAVVSIQLIGSAIIDPITAALAALSAILLFRWHLNSLWLLLVGSMTGIFFHSGL